MCGADVAILLVRESTVGSPPRVRSRRIRVHQLVGLVGITSACAEQTRRSSNRPTVAWDHLRVCGADWQELQQLGLDWGSPPRVRSRLLLPLYSPINRGITSACAEQTSGLRSAWTSGRDHLRVCGADTFALMIVPPMVGSPPRVRSRPSETLHRWWRGRITSACAEQTIRGGGIIRLVWDHLRVCGADSTHTFNAGHSRGSPPRVRSRRCPVRWTVRPIRITSACAEQTKAANNGPWVSQDHLRVCGADKNK